MTRARTRRGELFWNSHCHLLVRGELFTMFLNLHSPRGSWTSLIAIDKIQSSLCSARLFITMAILNYTNDIIIFETNFVLGPRLDPPTFRLRVRRLGIVYTWATEVGEPTNTNAMKGLFTVHSYDIQLALEFILNFCVQFSTDYSSRRRFRGWQVRRVGYPVSLRNFRLSRLFLWYLWFRRWRKVGGLFCFL